MHAHAGPGQITVAHEASKLLVFHLAQAEVEF